MAGLGVFPVYNLVFKIGKNGLSSNSEVMVPIADLETFSPSIGGTVEKWNPLDTSGWARALMTGKDFSMSLKGKRNVGDPGNDYVAGLAWKDGLDCSTKAEITFPDGSKLTFNCVVDVKTPFGGDSTNVSTLEFDLIGDGKPTYTPASELLSTSKKA